MAKRSVTSGVISFGLVTIPVKFYTACMANNVKFVTFTPDKKRVKQLFVKEGTTDVVERKDLIKGFEVSKGSYVTFTKDEIKELEEKEAGEILIKEFVPAGSVDLLQVEKSYYLGPGKGGDKAYSLLSQSLVMTNRYAVAQWTARGRQHLVVIRPYKQGLVIHQMFYADEVREFDSDAATTTISNAEIEMACKLIEVSSKDSYDSNAYHDSFKEKVNDAVARKKAGKENETVNDEHHVEVVTDLFDALKASLKESA